jgi:hypothetical protein
MKQFILFLCIATISTYGQTISRQTIASQGTSKVLSNGIFISQSVGQQSVIGNYKGDVNLNQGFQQSQWNRLLSSNPPKLISTLIYPNPFLSTIHFQFSQPVLQPIAVAIFDVTGKLVYRTTKSISNSILQLDLQNLAVGVYFVRLQSTTFQYYSKIVKQL